MPNGFHMPRHPHWAEQVIGNQIVPPTLREDKEDDESNHDVEEEEGNNTKRAPGRTQTLDHRGGKKPRQCNAASKLKPYKAQVSMCPPNHGGGTHESKGAHHG